jgi:hypothetical protein
VVQDNPASTVVPVPVNPARALQVVDPAVSKEKFDQETKLFLHAMNIHRKRGIIVLDCSFPDIKLAFCAPHIKPSPIVFAVNINFTNYDLQPLSVKFIDPFSFTFLSQQQLVHPFGRKIGIVNGQPQMQPLALGLPDGTAFICLPGIREYHDHPDHSNDPWLTHRGKGGEGTLGFIVDKLHLYGISAIKNLNLKVDFVNAGITFDGNKLPS